MKIAHASLLAVRRSGMFPMFPETGQSLFSIDLLNSFFGHVPEKAFMYFISQTFRTHEIKPRQTSWKTLMYNKGGGHQACDITQGF
jgi:hypothetical protein